MLKAISQAYFLPALRKVLQIVCLSLLFLSIFTGSAFTGSAIAQSNTPSPTPPPAQSSGIERPSQTNPMNQDQTIDVRKTAPQSPEKQESTTSVRRANRDRPQDPYEDYYDSIEKFNQEVYGENG